ncbi:MAG: hypothetical protein UH249_06990 [Acutalibacteraceae bacterium]|nr:hypothetical protein [Acutalibacteraceae bacterium]
MKRSKILALLLALVMMFTLFAGCGENGTTDTPTDIPASEKSSSTSITDKPSEDNATSDNIILDSTAAAIDGVNIPESDNSSALPRLSWVYNLNNQNTITIVTDYSAETNLVEHLALQIEINTDYPDYENMKTELKSYKIIFDEADDPKASPYKYTENPDGSISFYCHLYDLCGADRASRAVLVTRTTGIWYSNEDYTLNINEVEEMLTAAGFKKQ